MNRSKIEWTDYTWNPITGCLHNCPYCYAKRMVKRFSGDIRLNKTDPRIQKQGDLFVITEPFTTRNNRTLAYPTGFAPTLHKYRLEWPSEVKNGANIFVGSMADVFGDWVPDEWIEQIFESCEKYPIHNYLFLTKNPNRYARLFVMNKLPALPNFWYGTSITKETDFYPPVPKGDYNTFVSMEPLLSDLGKELLRSPTIDTDWIIIGAETGNRKDKVIPKKEWIDNIVNYCDKYNIPVFMKDSLIEIVGEENMRREFPKALLKKNESPKMKSKLYSNCCVCKKEAKKSEMTAILIRKARGESAIASGYVCQDCEEEFLKGLLKK